MKLLIEPQDDVEIGAWPAKAHGILSIARKSVHIELPLHSALRSEKSRDVYTRVVSELINQAVQDLWSPTGKPVAPSSAPLGRNPERERLGMAGARVEGSI